MATGMQGVIGRARPLAGQSAAGGACRRPETGHVAVAADNEREERPGQDLNPERPR